MANKTVGQPKNNQKVENKKKFNKKKWREQKYSVKSKVLSWQEKRKAQLEHQYKKQLRKEGLSVGETSRKNEITQLKPTSRLKEAQRDFQIRKEQEKLRSDEARQIREEKQLKIKQYREKKAERLRKLSQKTRKGQPLMKGRLELLQEKIERLVAENKL